MTREEMWKEFENQLIRETRTPITVSYDVSEKMIKSAIEATVAKWQERLERELSNSEKPNKSEIPTGSTVVDCISRKSVIAIIQNHWWNCRDIDKLVNKLPSVIPKGHWISTAEDLPNIDEDVLVTDIHGNITVYTLKDDWEAVPLYWEDDAGYYVDFSDVVAWMLLPQPYKAESEGV